MRGFRKVIEIDEEKCNGCGLCVPSCAEGAIEVINGKAKLAAEKFCDGLGACLGECPQDALKVIEREAEEFNHEAVEAHLKPKALAPAGEAALPCGCPSATLQALSPQEEADEVPGGRAESALSHWPVQIRLVPPTAPFLKGADLLVAADCTTVAYPNFHQDFLRGKVVLVGCPKFDDAQAYIQKFSEIFKAADIKTITVVVMEVPCCQGLPVIIKKGMEEAGKKIPMEEVIIGTQGNILH